MWDTWEIGMDARVPLPSFGMTLTFVVVIPMLSYQETGGLGHTRPSFLATSAHASWPQAPIILLV